MPHAPTATDVEQLRHVAADADGEPLSDDDLAFLASAQDVLCIDDYGAPFVVGIAQTRYYQPAQIRAAIADARSVATQIGTASKCASDESAVHGSVRVTRLAPTAT
jgi:hypothetical protein